MVNPYIERMNYENDPRVQAGKRGDWYSSFSEATMTAVVKFTDEDDEGEEIEVEVSFPCRFEVCGTCDGKGKHVDPNIDCCGLTREDFDEDPDFQEDYFAGRHDVTCFECHGKRVVPEVNEDLLNEDQKKALNRLRERQRDEAEWEAEARAERMMGA